MKALCITGIDNNHLKEIAAPFYDAGMGYPNAIQREAKIDFNLWHQKVSDALQAHKPIGRVWESLATDLLLANLDSECWGWYEEKSVAALDFWADLEPNIHFLLVCTRPEQEIAEKMLQSDSNQAAQAWLDDWYDRHQNMLSFYLKHPERCLLMDATDAQQHLTGQLAIANKHWQLPLDPVVENDVAQENLQTKETTQEQNNKSNVSQLIVRELIKQSDKDIVGLFQEIQAAKYPFPGHQTANEQMAQFMDWLKTDLDASQLQSILNDYQKLHKEAGNAQKLLNVKAESEQQQTQSKQALEQAKQENELLLLQLHQVQEELESTYGQKQSAEKQLTEQTNDLKQKLKQAEQALEQARVKGENTAELQQENELLLLQLHQVQEELEHYFSEHQTLSKESNAAKEENRQLKHKLRIAEQSKPASSNWLVKMLSQKSGSAEPKLQFDDVQLLHEQVNPDYEHLWLKLKNPSFGEHLVDEWTFRLSCAGISPNEFGAQPKLELPEQTSQLLEQWFSESENEHGKKLELRFALPNSMDAGVFKKIAPTDQQLIRSLVQQLPDMLSQLEQKGRMLSRNWNDWKKLAEDMQRILKTKAKR